MEKNVSAPCPGLGRDLTTIVSEVLTDAPK